MNDVVVNKVQSIQRCVLRAREEYRDAGGQFLGDYTRQDAAILNITRACEQAIDLANHLIRSEKLGIQALMTYSLSPVSACSIIARLPEPAEEQPQAFTPRTGLCWRSSGRRSG